MTRYHVRRLLVTMLTILIAQGAWAACSTGGQLVRLEASPAKCSDQQLLALDETLSNRLEFRAVLDLPLATQVLRKRKCPTAQEFEDFMAAWKRLPGTGVHYTVKRYCQTKPTVYRIHI